MIDILVVQIENNIQSLDQLSIENMTDASNNEYKGKNRENREADPSGKPLLSYVKYNSQREGQRAPVHHIARGNATMSIVLLVTATSS
ncbi:unnamed protein product [Adineta ricciae]|uniref:Uncharacterized protein n=1 Tax=Adineta ricciae TaxID=249248 RepID=A0A815GJ66_ADIRI|nr:unnamed protein product [Adineta ricciae]CAF1628678.1 unnamed protein product [Adineta ricciae]